MFGFIFSGLTLRKAFNKGIREGSILWRYFFFVIVIFRVLKWLMKRAQPKTEQQYDLSPGEYKVTVKDAKTEQ